MFENLTAETTTLPGITRNRTAGPNPFKNWVSESYAEKVAKSVTIPGENVTKAISLIRSAANSLGVGVRVVVLDSKGKTLSADDLKDLKSSKSKAQYRVGFQAQDKRAYTPRTPKA